MAFTKVSAAGIETSSNITVNNINTAGVITATSISAVNGTFSGNVSVAGTLTYEDVTNIDSIGIVTARSGVVINSGGLLVTAGVSTFGGGVSSLNVTGVSTVGVLTVTGNAGFTTTSHVLIAKGTSAQRPGTPVAGMIRYNTENQQFEGYAAAWGGFGGAAGASGNAVFYENDTNVTASYQITSGKNAMSAGPITLNAGVVVTIPSGSVWTVV